MPSVHLKFDRAPRFVLLLLSIIAELMLAPLLAGSESGVHAAQSMAILVMLAALWAAGGRAAAVVLFIPTITAHLLVAYGGASLIRVVSQALKILFFGYTTGLIVWRTTRRSDVTIDTIAGAACAYTLLALVWAKIYMLVEILHPGSFTIPAAWLMGDSHDPSAALAYFSFVTLTTVGYGDITPAWPGAGGLAAAEAIVGQLYLAITIARLVGLHASQRSAPEFTFGALCGRGTDFATRVARMHTTTRTRTTSLIAALLGALTAAIPGAIAHAKGSNAGTLEARGRARGDISREQGETDHITIDLEQGASVTIRFSASFAATLVLTDPDGAAVDLGAAGGRHLTVTDRLVDKSGQYDFAVSSGDGSQGVYTLLVKPQWAKTLPIAGTGHQVVDVAMPPNGRIAGVVHGANGAAGHPEIVSLEDPTGSALLQSPIVGDRGTAKLPATPTPAGGTYHLTVDATDATSAWTGTVTRMVPNPPSTSLSLTNGLDVVSYSGDGVGTVFARRCGSCHGWATSYAGVRAYAYAAFGRITGGAMPPGAPLNPSDIALIRTWIRTGRAR